MSFKFTSQATLFGVLNTYFIFLRKHFGLQSRPFLYSTDLGSQPYQREFQHFRDGPTHPGHHVLAWVRGWPPPSPEKHRVNHPPALGQTEAVRRNFNLLTCHHGWERSSCHRPGPAEPTGTCSSGFFDVFLVLEDSRFGYFRIFSLEF